MPARLSIKSSTAALRLGYRARPALTMSLSYAQALGTNRKPPSNTVKQSHLRPQQEATTGPSAIPNSPDDGSNGHSPNPAYIAKTSLPESGSYVLTFLTSRKHHDTLTTLRSKYFPARLNHLDAHLTLFHALPGSKLDDAIIPSLISTASSTRKFKILASTPFKLKKGIAIGVPKSAGGDASRDIHAQLKRQWREFLSDQDAGGFAPHYTIMNKVTDEKQIQHAFDEVQQNFKAVSGTVEGLSLWLYVGPGWEWKQDFEFRD